MQQYVAAAGHAGADHGPDARVRRQGRLQRTMNLEFFHNISKTVKKIRSKIGKINNTVLVLRFAQRKWKETKQEPSMLSGAAVHGSCLVSFHILWAILSTSTVQSCVKTFLLSFENHSQPNPKLHYGQAVEKRTSLAIFLSFYS